MVMMLPIMFLQQFRCKVCNPCCIANPAVVAFFHSQESQSFQYIVKLDKQVTEHGLLLSSIQQRTALCTKLNKMSRVQSASKHLQITNPHCKAEAGVMLNKKKKIPCFRDNSKIFSTEVREHTNNLIGVKERQQYRKRYITFFQ